MKAPVATCFLFVNLTFLRPIPAADAPDRVRLLEATFDALETALADVPLERFDLQVVAAQVGRTPAALCRWVARETWWIPYSGSLRGARGVLADRLGNSLDRALLLAELLRAAGHSVELAHATLDAATAAQLEGRLRPLPDDWFQGPKQAGPTPASIEKLARILGMTPEQMQRVGRRRDASSDRIAEAAAARIAEQIDLLMPLVKDRLAAEKPVPRAFFLADHWWVRCKQEGKWTELDPDGGEDLAPPAKSDRTVAPAKDGFRLDAKLAHEVEVRLVNERRVGQEVSEQVVLRHVLRPAEVFGQSIVLVQVPLGWNLEEKVEDLDAAIREAVLAQKVWLPILFVGSRAISKFRFDTSGEVTEREDDAAAEIAGKTDKSAGNIGGIFGGDESPEEAHLTAQWLEYQIRVPGKPARTIRRPIFDILGAKARASPPESFAPDQAAQLRRGFALLGRTDIFVQSCLLAPDVVAVSAARRQIDAREEWIDAAREPDALARTSKLRHLMVSSGPEAALQNLALMRTVLSPVRAQAFLDSPDIFNFRSSMGLDAQGKLIAREAVDLVANGMAVRADSPVPPALVRLQQGVTDTVVEDLVLTDLEGATENTACLFGLAEAGGAEPVLIADARDARLAGLQMTNAVRALAVKDLKGGCALVLPARPAAFGDEARWGWWRVDLKSGESVGVMDSGLHGVSEDTIIRDSPFGMLRRQVIKKVASLSRGRVTLQQWKTLDYMQIASRLGVGGCENMQALSQIMTIQDWLWIWL